MWSRPRLVKAPAASLTPSSRRWSSPWLDASIAACVTPSSASSLEQAVQRDRIGRRQRAVFVAAGRDDAGRADAGRRLAVLLPDLPDEGSDRRLAAGAGDGDHRVGLLAEEARRRQRQRQPRIGDFDHRHRGRGQPGAARRDDGRSAALCRIGGIGCAVGLRAGQRKEQEARLDRRANRTKPQRRRCCQVCPPSTGRIPAKSLSFIEFQS